MKSINEDSEAQRLLEQEASPFLNRERLYAESLRRRNQSIQQNMEKYMQQVLPNEMDRRRMSLERENREEVEYNSRMDEMYKMREDARK